MIQTQTKYSTYAEPDELLKIFLVLGNAKYPTSKASATVVAYNEDQVFDMVGIYEVEEITHIGYATEQHREPRILYQNSGEYINQDINN